MESVKQTVEEHMAVFRMYRGCLIDSMFDAFQSGVLRLEHFTSYQWSNYCPKELLWNGISVLPSFCGDNCQQVFAFSPKSINRFFEPANSGQSQTGSSSNLTIRNDHLWPNGRLSPTYCNPDTSGEITYSRSSKISCLAIPLRVTL